MNDLTPAESEAVRRLLADARSDEQLPPEVAARLEGVIAGLAADRTAPDSPPEATDPSPADDSPADQGVVVPLRRRRWPQVLVAAAAVTAIAMAGTQLLGDTTSDQDNASPAAEDNGLATPLESDGADNLAESPSPYDRDGRASQGHIPKGTDPARGEADLADRTELGRNLDGLGVRQLAPLPVETSAFLTTLSELTKLGQLAGQEYATGDSPASTSRGVANAPACGPLYSVDGARFFAARYRGHVALVLAHPDLQGLRLVEVYDCQGPTPRRSAELVTLVAGE